MLTDDTNHNLYAYQQYITLLSIQEKILSEIPVQAQAPTRAEKTKGFSQY